jgi:hypothetical protein
MTRLKFFVFAIVALGLGASQLVLSAASLDPSTNDRAVAVALAASSRVALRLEEQRSRLQSVALRLATSAAGNVLAAPKAPAPAKPPKPEPPTEERLVALRDEVLEGLAPAAQAEFVVGLVNETGALFAVGPAPAASAPASLDLAALTSAAGASLVVDAWGALHLVLALPWVGAEKSDAKSATWVLLGLPLLSDPAGLVADLAKDTPGASVGVSSEGALIAVAGDRVLLEKALKLDPGVVAALTRGSLDALGPVALPLFAPWALEAGAQRPIGGTPFGVVAVTSVRPAMQVLAQIQKVGLIGLAGLALLTLAVALVLGGEQEHEGPSMVLPPPVPIPPRREKKDQEGSVRSALLGGPGIDPGVTGRQDVLPPSPDGHLAPEVSPDDFDFPQTSPRMAVVEAPPPAPPQAPSLRVPQQPQSSPGPGVGRPPLPAESDLMAALSEDPFAGMGDSSGPTVVVAAGLLPAAPPQRTMGAGAAEVTNQRPAPGRTSRELAQEEEPAQTRAYPAFRSPPGPAPSSKSGPPVPPPPPAAARGASATAEADEDGEDDLESGPADSGESTRIAMVSPELMRQARASAPQVERTPAAHKPQSATPMPPQLPKVAPVSEEDKHFQDVFREFLVARERCGESSEGLTFEKFKAKLVKNKEQLVAKYNSKTVRFQVYVKEGKAALKASPVKE